MNAAPGATVEAMTKAFAHSATVGVRIRDGQGNDTLARTVTGVTEDVTVGTSAVFRKTLTAPSTAGQYWIVWDDGSAVDVEELLVTYTTPAAGSSTGDYITEAELKAARELTGLTFADGQIPTVITAASRVVDELCGKRRRFYLDTDNTSVRYYTPTRSDYLEIDDIVDIQTVQTDLNGDGTFEQTWTVDRDYIADPLNAAADGRPFERLCRTWNSTFYFPCRVRSVKVTGQFGWLTVPADVELATTILATRYLLRAREAPAGIITIGGPVEGSMMRLARTDPDVPGLLERFCRKTPIL